MGEVGIKELILHRAKNYIPYLLICGRVNVVKYRRFTSEEIKSAVGNIKALIDTIIGSFSQQTKEVMAA